MIEGRANVSILTIRIIIILSNFSNVRNPNNLFHFQELPDFQVFSTVIKYCLVIIIVPVLAFFSVKVILFDGILRLEPVTSSVYSAVIAVIVLHVTLGLYIYKAYGESSKPSKPVKKD